MAAIYNKCPECGVKNYVGENNGFHETNLHTCGYCDGTKKINYILVINYGGCNEEKFYIDTDKAAADEMARTKDDPRVQVIKLFKNYNGKIESWAQWARDVSFLEL